MMSTVELDLFMHNYYHYLEMSPRNPVNTNIHTSFCIAADNFALNGHVCMHLPACSYHGKWRNQRMAYHQ